MRAILILFLFVTACTPLRVFQTKVPDPVIKSPIQVEAERQGADLIARKLETPIELKPVAVSLSASLGSPQKSLVDVKTFDLPQAATHANIDLQSGILQMQHQLDILNQKLTKLQGKEVEGTGFSILGPGVSTIVIGLILLGVIFPPAFTLMGIAYRRLRQTAGMVVNQIDSAAKAPETADAVKKIKAGLKNTMDLANKQVIHALQKPTT